MPVPPRPSCPIIRYLPAVVPIMTPWEYGAGDELQYDAPAEVSIRRIADVCGSRVFFVLRKLPPNVSASCSRDATTVVVPWLQGFWTTRPVLHAAAGRGKPGAGPRARSPQRPTTSAPSCDG